MIAASAYSVLSLRLSFSGAAGSAAAPYATFSYFETAVLLLSKLVAEFFCCCAPFGL